MLNLSAALWPLFWTIIGSGLALTAALCWLTAVVRTPHGHQAQQPLLPLRPTSRYTESRRHVA